MGALLNNYPTPNAQTHARDLRRDMTESERRLWSRLRREQMGVKFRRQHPVGNYIADFACLAPKLILELDGSQHQNSVGYDTARDTFFQSDGFAVLRFATDQPFRNLEGMLTVIHEAVTQVAPPSQPSPAGGRSKDQNAR